jgi:hypothetical protein
MSSGQSVDASVFVAKTPESDLERLTAYILKRFPVRDQQLTAQTRAAAALKLKGDIITLGFEAIDFRRELSGWIALTTRVRDEMYADAIDSSHGERQAQAQAVDLKRADSTLVRTRAAATISPLNEALERLQESRTEMDKIVSWCQSLQRSVRDEEFGDLFESSSEVPEQIYSAPIGAALRKLEH